MNADRAGGDERSTLRIVLVLNVAIAVAFLVAGTVADSSALIANGLDNTSDASVYILSIVAIGRSRRWKRRVAILAGSVLLAFAVIVVVDVVRRMVEGSAPIAGVMMAMSAVAAVVNYICFRLLQRIPRPDVTLRAATTFSFNDLIANGGILVAGVLVWRTGANWPDLVVGVATALIAVKGGVEILRDARREGHQAATAGS